MTRRVRRHRAVADDIVDQGAYLLRDGGQEVALRFWERTEQTIRWIAPGAGHLRDFDDLELANVRSWPVKGFRKHLILYEVEREGIYLLAVVHGARDLPPLLRGRAKHN
jgi:plasmid stabilization system protein ParE